jgi:hypothetical protein
MMRPISFKLFATVLIVFGMSFQAEALTITPATAPCGTPTCLFATGNDTSQDDINDALAALGIPGPELYKQNVGEATDSGAFAGSYTTTFQNTPTEPAGATIVWDGAPDPFINSDPVYLLIKDGKLGDPAWYLYSLDWDGMETITLSGFWEGAQGSISHVAIYGTATSVPDSGSIAMLLGMALMGLAGVRRLLN